MTAGAEAASLRLAGPVKPATTKSEEKREKKEEEKIMKPPPTKEDALSSNKKEVVSTVSVAGPFQMTDFLLVGTVKDVLENVSR